MEKEQILSHINTYTPEEICMFLSQGIITKEELFDCGIPYKVIDILDSYREPNFHYGELSKTVPQENTEVYFWGIPGSGITCALGALLNTAAHLGILYIEQSPGYAYAQQLKSIFYEDYCKLPSATPIDVLQYLPITLKNVGEKHPRYVSLIEKCGGEIFKYFYYMNAGQELPTQSHKDTFDTLVEFLNGNNRKIHFFVIDYEMGNRAGWDGLTQSDYLQAAATFFRANDIFRKSTDAIYIVVTKSDLMPCRKEERVEYAKRYLEDNYGAFIYVLKDYCRKYGLNNLSVIPFSLGKVYFRRICDFDRESSKQILDILTNQIKPRKKSILDILFKNR